MPKKGIVKCESCAKEFEGTLPDHEFINYEYSSVESGDRMDKNLVSRLKNHHLETAHIRSALGNVGGHKIFLVFLENGEMGTVEASSYAVHYKELGKERD